MEALIESVRAALAGDAGEEARAAGADACRTILTALDAKPGEPMAAPASAIASAAPAPGLPVAAIVSAPGSMPTDQLLEAAIARLRAALPPGTDIPRAAPLKFHIVPLQRG